MVKNLRVPNECPAEMRPTLERVVDDMRRIDRAAKYFPPYTVATKPDATAQENWYRGILITDAAPAAKPAWSDTAVWRYADGTAV